MYLSPGRRLPAPRGALAQGNDVRSTFATADTLNAILS